MIEITCDRCGKKMKNPKKIHRHTLCIFKAPTKAKYEIVDLCSGCEEELSAFKALAESYFMNNKDYAIDIFEKTRYYCE